MVVDKNTKADDLIEQMWERLSASPESLNLNVRSDEQPEDLFVRLYNSGQKETVVQALKENLCKIVTCRGKKEKGVVFRFMERALRLCDVLGAVECKPDLQYILLHSEEGGSSVFQKVRVLAARALDGLRKEAEDFEFWRHLAERRDGVLAYALNALIEIDLHKGLEIFLYTYMTLQDERRIEVVDWQVVLQIACDMYGAKKLSRVLDHRLGLNPNVYENFVRHVGHPELSLVGKRSLGEFASYKRWGSESEERAIQHPKLQELYGQMTERIEGTQLYKGQKCDMDYGVAGPSRQGVGSIVQGYSDYGLPIPTKTYRLES